MPVRRATRSDADAVVGTSADSHLDCAWEAWALDGADRRVRFTRLVRPFIEVIALPSREVWMQDDGDDLPAGAPETWVMWRPPAAAERTQYG